MGLKTFKDRGLAGLGSPKIGLRKKTPCEPIMRRKIERLRKKRLFAGKWKTGTLEVGMSVITRESEIKSPCNELARAFKWSYSVIFFARRGRRRRRGGMDSPGG